jgi:hypothetical protein
LCRGNDVLKHIQYKKIGAVFGLTGMCRAYVRVLLSVIRAFLRRLHFPNSAHCRTGGGGAVCLAMPSESKVVFGWICN